MHRAVVTAFGSDRPGIVAAVTGVLVRHGANLADTAMTNLAGQFAMVLVVEVPGEEEAPALERALLEETAPLGLTVAVRALPDEAERVPTARAGTQAWAISLYGADRPGIVHQVANVLAEREANVVDLTTRTIGTPEEPVYVMLLDVDLPAAADEEELRSSLARVAEDLRVEIHLRVDEADEL